MARDDLKLIGLSFQQHHIHVVPSMIGRKWRKDHIRLESSMKLTMGPCVQQTLATLYISGIDWKPRLVYFSLSFYFNFD